MHITTHFPIRIYGSKGNYIMKYDEENGNRKTNISYLMELLSLIALMILIF